MTEQITIGSVTCDFLSQLDFRQLCQHWLQGSNLHHVVTLNPEMVLLAERNQDFRSAVQAAAIRVPDGSGIIWARWYLRSKVWSLWSSLGSFFFIPVERITGVDTVMMLSKVCATNKQAIYLLGGTVHQVPATTRFLKHMCPDLQIFTSVKHGIHLEDPQIIIQDIKRSRAAVLFVAYGAPKQTLWIERYRHQLPSVKIAVGVGGAFAMLAEELPRAPRWLRRFNLEWLWRLYLQPSRAKRIWSAVVLFPWLVKKQKLTFR